jgi:plastocyanin
MFTPDAFTSIRSIRSIRSIARRAAAVATVSAFALSLVFPAAVAIAQDEGEPPVEAAQAVEAVEAAGGEVAVAAAIPVAQPLSGTARVTMTDNRNTPFRIVVPAGTTVTWVNAGLAPHTATASNGSFDSGFVQPGGSFAYTFDAPGEYVYFCRPHVFIGMTGTVVVE